MIASVKPLTCMNSSIWLKTDLVLGKEWMSGTGVHHILIPVKHTSNRNIKLMSCHGNVPGQQVKSSFFSAKATAESLGSDMNVMEFNAKYFGDLLLTHVQILTTDVNLHLLAIVHWFDIACVCLEIKMLLTAHSNLGLECVS